jgi:hypothetical protein
MFKASWMLHTDTSLHIISIGGPRRTKESPTTSIVVVRSATTTARKHSSNGLMAPLVPTRRSGVHTRTTRTRTQDSIQTRTQAQIYWVVKLCLYCLGGKHSSQTNCSTNHQVPDSRLQVAKPSRVRMTQKWVDDCLAFGLWLDTRDAQRNHRAGTMFQATGGVMRRSGYRYIIKVRCSSPEFQLTTQGRTASLNGST